MRKKIAFLILAHEDPVHLLRLCRALGPYDDIFVHLDKRASLGCRDYEDFGKNVKFTERRIAVFWSDISVVEATLILLEEALQTGDDYLRLVLLSGSCYPVKSVDTLRAYFIAGGDHIEMKYVNILEHPAQTVPPSATDKWLMPWLAVYQRARRANRHLVVFDRMTRKLIGTALKPVERRARSKFPGLIRYIGPLRARAEPWANIFRDKFPQLVPYVGSQFWSITPQCAKMILQFVRNNSEFVNFHKDSFAPDEHFFHTIVGNSALAKKTDGVAEGTDLNNLHVPRIPCATIESLDAILASNGFFVRKVTTGRSGQLLDYLDEHVLI